MTDSHNSSTDQPTRPGISRRHLVSATGAAAAAGLRLQWNALSKAICGARNSLIDRRFLTWLYLK